ncbi:outer membrane protein [Bradyrhizobium zhanjiangense]|uniref:outer membrane protein n=1 Tax=Bradyrhizobium zhanjiangense TaxID=1325107 RepID=UPI001FE05EAC|nr:outer membrane beta-barrel protein [Bradyrhizobium zhanjiangense]
MIATCKAGPNVFVTGTARVGYTFGARGRTLTYVKAGAAWQNNCGSIANNDEFHDDGSPGFPQHTTQFDYGRFGWTVGLGVEQAMTAAWSLKFEYDYMRFARPHLATPPTMQSPPFAVIRQRKRFIEQLSSWKGRLELSFRRRPESAGMVPWIAVPRKRGGRSSCISR